MKSKKNNAATLDSSSFVHIDTHGKEIQEFGTIMKMPIGLDEAICQESVEMLNQILADTMVMRDLYKKHHWQVSGPNFYSLHLLFDKHYGEQAELIDTIAERIQTLGGLSIAMGSDASQASTIPTPPRGREVASIQISRLLIGHETICKKVRKGACRASELGDDGTNDVLVSEVLRTNELQAWFLAEHLVRE